MVERMNEVVVRLDHRASYGNNTRLSRFREFPRVRSPWMIKSALVYGPMLESFFYTKNPNQA